VHTPAEVSDFVGERQRLHLVERLALAIFGAVLGEPVCRREDGGDELRGQRGARHERGEAQEVEPLLPELLDAVGEGAGDAALVAVRQRVAQPCEAGERAIPR